MTDSNSVQVSIKITAFAKAGASSSTAKIFDLPAKKKFYDRCLQLDSAVVIVVILVILALLSLPVIFFYIPTVSYIAL